MSRIPVREWYERTNAEWEVGRVQCGGELPIPTADEALKGARKLFRFATGRSIKKAELTSGNRYTWPRRGVLMVNPDRRETVGRGWQSIVHDISHYAHNGKPHCKAQAILEKNMIREVIKRGFLVGSLRGEMNPSAVVIVRQDAILNKPGQNLIANVASERAKDKLKAIKARIKRWQSKAKRAENALKKLARQEKYYEKRANQ